MNIEGIENIGKTLSCVTVGHGSFRVTALVGGGSVSVETWDIEEPEQLFLTAGTLIYVDNRGEIADVIGSAAFLRLERVS